MLHGRRVRLEPLTPDHVPGLFAAGRDADVWRWLWAPAPVDEVAMARIVADSIAMPGRIAWAIVADGVAGTTSYYAIDVANSGLEIGYTWLGRPWWRTGPLPTSARFGRARCATTSAARTARGATRCTSRSCGPSGLACARGSSSGSTGPGADHRSTGRGARPGSAIAAGSAGCVGSDGAVAGRRVPVSSSARATNASAVAVHV